MNISIIMRLKNTNSSITLGRRATELIILTLLTGLFITVGKVRAQQKLSLQDCIDIAIENNLQYQQSKLDTKQKEESLKQQKFDRLPSLNLSGNQGFQFGRNIDPYTNTFVQERINTNRFSLNGSIPIFEGFKLTNQIKSSKLSLKASDKADQAMKNEIKLQVTSYYLDVLLQREAVDNAVSRMETTKSTLEKTRILVKSGKTNKTEAMELESQLASERSQLVQARNQLKMAKLTLNQYMNREKGKALSLKTLSLPDSLGSIELQPIEKVVQENYNRLPQIQQARNNLRSAGFSLKAAKGNRYPSLSLNASASTGYSSRTQEPVGFNRSMDTVGFLPSSQTPIVTEQVTPEFGTIPFWDQIDNNFSQVLTFQVNIPIFNNYNIQNQIETAKIQEAKAKLNLEKKKQDVRNTIQQASVQVQNSREKYKAAQKQLASQRSLFKRIDLQYNEGAIDFYKWQSNKNNLQQSKNELLQAKYQYLFDKKIYEFYLGKTLTINSYN